MKNKIILSVAVLFALLAGACLTACNNEENVNALSVYPASISFAGMGGTEEIRITADANVDWRIEFDENWIELSACSGRGDAVIRMKVQPNGSGAERKATLALLVKDGDRSAIDITQQPTASGEVRFNVTPLSLTFDADGLGSAQVIEIDTNLPSWDCHADEDWIILTPDVENGRILVNVKENPYIKKLRIADFVISAPGTDNVSIAITQDKNFINRLLGEWTVNEWFYFASVPTAIANGHTVTITKIDANTIRIDNIMNINHQIVNYDMPEAEYGTYCDFITAKVDNRNQKINIDIPYKLSYKWYNNKYDIYYSRMDSTTWTDNFKEDVWSIQVEEKNGNLEINPYGNLVYSGYKASFGSLAVNSATGEFSGGFAFLIDSKWVKQYDYSTRSPE